MRPGRPWRVRNVERAARSVTKAARSTGRWDLPPAFQVGRSIWRCEARPDGRPPWNVMMPTTRAKHGAGQAQCEARLFLQRRIRLRRRTRSRRLCVNGRASHGAASVQRSWIACGTMHTIRLRRRLRRDKGGRRVPRQREVGNRRCPFLAEGVVRRGRYLSARKRDAVGGDASAQDLAFWRRGPAGAGGRCEA